MKKIVSLFLAVLLAAASLPGWTAAAAEQEIVVDVTDPGYQESPGDWKDSGLKGYQDGKTRFLSGKEAYATWTADLKPGVYKVEIFKVVEKTTDQAAKIQVTSAKKTKEKILNYTQGTSGWEDLGEYIASEGNPILVKNTKSPVGVIRTSAVRFTFLREASGTDLEPDPTPTPKPIRTPEPEDGKLNVKINGRRLKFDQDPVMMNDRTLVPLRGIFEALGAVVTWNEDTQGIVGVKGDRVIKLQIDSATAYVNNQEVTLDQSAVLLGNRTLVPVRFISESMECKVDWDESTQSVLITSDQEIYIPEEQVYLTAENFDELGTWFFDNNAAGAFDQMCLRGLSPADGTDPQPETAEPATGSFVVSQAGEYRLWVRSRDFSTNSATRFFGVSINGVPSEVSFGTHEQNGWAWQDGGTVLLKAGENEIALLDTSGFYPRMNAIFLTQDQSFEPPNEETEFEVAANMGMDFEKELAYPLWAYSDAAPTEQRSIENEHTKVVFSAVPSNMGITIQKEVYLKKDGQWVLVSGREDGFGYLLLRADSAELPVYQTMYPIYQTVYPYKGVQKKKMTANVYESGEPVWMIPDQMDSAQEGQVTVSASGPYGTLKAVWRLEEDDQEPEVCVSFTAKTEGVYSIGMFGKNREEDYEATDFLLAPLTINQKRFPDGPFLTLEQFSPNASTLETRTEDGNKITMGITVDPASIPYRWVYNNNAKFGLGIRGLGGGVQTSLFAPVIGMEDSKLASGETYSITYRPVAMLEDWDEAYRHIVTDIQGISDYRENYDASLTQAGFNIQKLLLNDQYSGWDKEMKAHYNMEGRNVVSNADPLVYLQAYLLTENDEILARRTIPTLEFMLSAGSFHYAGAGAHDRGTATALRFEKAQPWGNPVLNYNSDIFGGAYLMTRGQVPYLRQIGIDTPRVRDGIFIPKFSEYVWLYNYTGDKSWLEKAIPEADAFLEKEIYTGNTAMAGYNVFFNFQYVPYFVSLIDIYEATGEQKYLDGAAYGARQLMAGMWTSPQTPDTLQDNTIREDQIIQEDLWWAGDQQQRVGFAQDHTAITNQPETEQVPAWVTSRVGLGVETPATYRGDDKSKNSKNITAAQWAPELLRLAEYTGDSLFEVYARNAVIGRFANYPGYYINQFTTHQMKEEFPYEGPDTTNIYYHHIPTYLAMVQDFLITQAWSWSDQKIDFPAARTQGYVWFFNKHYGFEPGSIFDEDGMWLWMDEGIVQPDNIQIDYITAKKDGMFAAVLMNEDQDSVTTKVTLGEKLPEYEGEAILYRPDGSKTTVQVTDGALTATVPGKELCVVFIPIPEMKAPAYAQVSLSDHWNTPTGNTYQEDSLSKGYLLQMDPSKYFAYVCVPQETETGASAKLTYRIGNGSWKTETDTAYPLDFTIQVDQPGEAIEYYLELTQDGTTQKSETHSMKPAGM